MMIRSSILTVALLALLSTFNAVSHGNVIDITKELANSSVNIGAALFENIPDAIPNSADILSMGKEAVAGMPVEMFMKVINRLCSITIAANRTKPFQTPDPSEIKYILEVGTERITIPVTRAMDLWSHKLFDPKKNTTVFITGWLTDSSHPGQSPTARIMGEAYRTRNDINHVIVDTAKYVDTLYSWSAFNTKKVGEAIGKGIALLRKFLPNMYIHVMGHSLGAQMSGAAGQAFQLETGGELLPRITGLDPANPCFGEGEYLTGIFRGDAEFVDIIHTNPGNLGQRQPVGDVDFYVNGFASLQPGSLDMLSSHERAVDLFAQTVYQGRENSFMAQKCSSLSALDAGRCLTKKVPMGLSCPTNAKGNFLLRTSGRKPFTL